MNSSAKVRPKESLYCLKFKELIGPTTRKMWSLAGASSLLKFEVPFSSSLETSRLFLALPSGV
jgi:hypothetical protein